MRYKKQVYFDQVILSMLKLRAQPNITRMECTTQTMGM